MTHGLARIVVVDIGFAELAQPHGGLIAVTVLAAADAERCASRRDTPQLVILRVAQGKNPCRGAVSDEG